MRFPKPTKVRLFRRSFFFSVPVPSAAYRVPRIAGGFGQRDPPAISGWALFPSDPLVAMSNALPAVRSTRACCWSLVVLIPTMFLGRFFCGWICPLGSIHHFFSSFKSERKRGKQLIESNRYKRWQTTKYYLLIVSLIAALLGTGIVGLAGPVLVSGALYGLVGSAGNRLWAAGCLGRT